MRIIWIVGALLFANVGRAVEGPVPLEFARLDLKDGRKLKDVVIKSYDAESGKVLLVASGKAMTVPVAQIPPPFSEWLKSGAPKSGVTTSGPLPPKTNGAGAFVQTSKSQSPLASQEAAARIAKPVVVVPTSPRPEPDPEWTAMVNAANTARKLGPHKEAARSRADTYFRFEHQAGSNNIKVTDLKIELEDPTPVTGWPGRYRIQGKAGIEYYDSKGGSFQRTTGTFEVVTEQKETGTVTVEGFIRKS